MSYEKLILKNVRLSYHDFDPEASGKSKYQAEFLLSEKHPQLEDVKAFFNKSLKNFRELSGKSKATWKYAPLVSGNEKNDTRETEGKDRYDFLDGHFILKANSGLKIKPAFVDNLKNKVSDVGSVFYQGCYVNAILSVSPTAEMEIETETGKQKMILCNRYLNAVMFAGHGSSIGSSGGGADLSVFETVSDIGTPEDSEDDLPF